MHVDNKNTIQKLREKCKLLWEAHEHDIFLIAVVFLLSIFLLGAIRLTLVWRAAGRAAEIRVEKNAFPVRPKQGLGQTRFMASINGEKYYPTGCKAANRIKEENRIWFASEKEAREMGYTPSAQC